MYVWDLPLRLFHWLLTIAILIAYITGTQGGLWFNLHAHTGIFILSLLVFRIAWGFGGTEYARFRQFFPTPARLRAHLSGKQPSVGHNPFGALSILAMLLVITAQAVLGLFSTNDEIEFHGPLYSLANSNNSDYLTSLHTQFPAFILLLIALHLTANAYYILIKRRDLLTPMITGKSKNPQVGPLLPKRKAGWQAILFSTSMAIVVFWILENNSLQRWLS